ncbi:hypothetical protein [Nocardioides acrostichi]|uniref:DUF4189 domain-containing protein n=1 Tax=Nocardioides acrostichi TaxID=2784339 RepID=A0A930Y5X7_9ACTN|nr:hypothetical protein [Nocardioides acrostichi]MBF4161720.1 hypothetical protein [Nocardioides acrostichi]
MTIHRAHAGARHAAAFAVVLTAAVLAPLSARADDARPNSEREPAGDTIVRVTGTADNGFGIEYYDGTSEFPPTMSEAMAECSAYAARVGRARCRVEVKTWYRDLEATKHAIRYAKRR